MKKILSCSISAICFLISATTAVNGQLASNHVKSGGFVILNKPGPGDLPGVGGRVNPAVIRSFLKSYKDVSNETWIQVKAGFVVMFNYNEIDYQVAYNKKGNVLRTIRSYNEGKMALDLRHIVKSNYYDYEINRVHEVETFPDPPIYFIQLVGKKEIINLAVHDGEMEVLEKFDRSK